MFSSVNFFLSYSQIKTSFIQWKYSIHFKKSYSDIIRFCELSHDARIQVQRDADIKLSKLTTEAIQDSTVRPKATNVVYDLNVVYYAYGKYTCTHVHNIMYVYMHLNMVVLKRRSP